MDEYYISDQGKKVKKKKCRARARTTGLPCSNNAMDNGKCYVHGGANHIPDRPDRPNYKHGIYCDALLEGEEEIYTRVKGDIDSLTEEIAMTKLKLRRAYLAQQVWEEGIEEDAVQTKVLGQIQTSQEKDMAPFQIERDVGTGINAEGERFGINKKKVVRKARDFSHEIHLLTSDLIRLIRAKAELQVMIRGPEYKESMARSMREFTQTAGGMIPEPGTAKLLAEVKDNGAFN